MINDLVAGRVHIEQGSEFENDTYWFRNTFLGFLESVRMGSVEHTNEDGKFENCRRHWS